MVTTNEDPPELPDGIPTSSSKGKDCCFTDPFVCGLPSSKAQAMVTINDDPPELPDGISTSSNKGKDSFSLQPCLEELVYEVFVRLPVKSLIRFRCVSKGYDPSGYYPSRTDGAQTFWVMEEYGVESSWSQLYGLYREHGSPMFYFPNSRSRLLCKFRGRLSWWDPQDGSFVRIQIPMLLNEPEWRQLDRYYTYTYVRNLVRLDQS